MGHNPIEVILARQLASHLAMPMFIVDPAGDLLFYNEPAEAILGRRFEEGGWMDAGEWSNTFQPVDENGEEVDSKELPVQLALNNLRPAHLHEVPNGSFDIGEFHIDCNLVCHPGPTVGYRIAHSSGASMAYLPDHEPALGIDHFPERPQWTSGYDIAQGVDLLIHDTQYTPYEYEQKVGWGHSSLTDALRFAQLA